MITLIIIGYIAMSFFVALGCGDKEDSFKTRYIESWIILVSITVILIVVAVLAILVLVGLFLLLMVIGWIGTHMP